MNIHGDWIKWEPCGSRITCNPAPTDTDADYLVLIKDHALFAQAVFAQDYTLGGSDVTDDNASPDSVFASYVKGEINLIATTSPVFFKRHMAATSVSKRLNLMDKNDRIALFQAVLYGNC